jgi:siroheme synthase-like protein
VYPIFLKLESVPCLVVGGGAVAARKVRGLLAAGARVTVVSPEAVAELAALARESRIAWRQRPYQGGDLAGFRLAIAATSSTEVNAQVYEEALVRGTLVNAVDDPRHSSFFVPSVVRRGLLTLAISTSGAVPYLARRLREHLEGRLSPELAREVEELRAVRARLAEEPPADRQARLQRELEPRVQRILAGLDGR